MEWDFRSYEFMATVSEDSKGTASFGLGETPKVYLDEAYTRAKEKPHWNLLASG